MSEPYKGVDENNKNAESDTAPVDQHMAPPPDSGNPWATDPMISKDVGFDIDESDIEFGGIELEDWEKEAIREIVSEDVRQREIAINSKIRSGFGRRFPNRERRPPAKQ